MVLFSGCPCCITCGCCVRLRTCKDLRPNAQVSAATEQECLADRKYVVEAGTGYFGFDPPAVVNLSGFTVSPFYGGPEGITFLIRLCSSQYFDTLQDAQSAVDAVQQWYQTNYFGTRMQLDYNGAGPTKVWLPNCGDTIGGSPWTDLTGATVTSCNTGLNPLP